MSVTTEASGTQTCVIGTEHFLYSPSPAKPGVFQLNLDLNAAADGDTFEVRLYRMVLAGGTARVIYRQTYANAQDADDKIKCSVPLINDLADNGAVQASIKQTTGTGRAIPYSMTRSA